jgi:hypothetical protein
VYQDIKGLVYTKSGKVEHDTTAHDDSLFGLLMIHYAVRYGNNIGRFLRDASAVKKNVERINALATNGVFNKIIDDPVHNKGIQVNLNDIGRLLESGESLESVLRHVQDFAANKKAKPINNNLMSQLFKR